MNDTTLKTNPESTTFLASDDATTLVSDGSQRRPPIIRHDHHHYYYPYPYPYPYRDPCRPRPGEMSSSIERCDDLDSSVDDWRSRGRRDWDWDKNRNWDWDKDRGRDRPDKRDRDWHPDRDRPYRRQNYKPDQTTPDMPLQETRLEWSPQDVATLANIDTPSTPQGSIKNGPKIA